ncbi:unnamed protein product [Cuscuta epithymum]|uniref:HMA domain-containing protein n=1 Tax=Cuscuta epithymum TaxID=186058 RepID=A0AAV0FZ29_9ASTE|nr:unnamed protein product [Cuscuta epithymum]
MADEEEPPASPFVLYVDLHCLGCAKKIERSIVKIRGVEGVVINMSTNQVTIKGAVEPNAICTKITNITKRGAKLLSPLPAAEGEPTPEVVSSQVNGLKKVELTVNMHCKACAQQLKRKILKMKGVRKVETEVDSGKVTVMGTMDAEMLVENVYRGTKKQAKIVPQIEPNQKENKEEKEKPADKPTKPDDEKTEGGSPPPQEEEEEISKNQPVTIAEEENASEGKKMMNYYQPLYNIERILPAPHIFSDENPHACCIS